MKVLASVANYSVRIEGSSLVITNSTGAEFSVSASGSGTREEKIAAGAAQPVLRIFDSTAAPAADRTGDGDANDTSDAPFNFELTRGGTVTTLFDIDNTEIVEGVDFETFRFQFEETIYDPIFGIIPIGTAIRTITIPIPVPVRGAASGLSGGVRASVTVSVMSRVEAIEGPFQPEGGAYGHGRTFGHEHHHHHD